MTNAHSWVVDASGLSFHYGEKKQVLKDVDLRVAKGSIVTVMGPSGCGKTTLLRLLSGLERMQQGTLQVLGCDLKCMDEDEIQQFRRRLGMCFQFGALLNSLTIYENLALPLRESKRMPEDLISIIIRSRLALVGLSGSECLMPAQLSGGMRKRAGLARGLVTDPELLLFDEPTSGLDPITAAELDRSILDVKDRVGATIVVVTHDLATAMSISDAMVMLMNGSVRASGSKEEIAACSDPEVKAFLTRSVKVGELRENHELLNQYFP